MNEHITASTAVGGFATAAWVVQANEILTLVSLVISVVSGAIYLGTQAYKQYRKYVDNKG